MATRRARTHSRRAIIETLKARGVDEATARSALDVAHTPDDASVMRELWQRRFGQPPADEREKARQVRFLQSRGFALTEILRFLRNLPTGSA